MFSLLSFSLLVEKIERVSLSQLKAFSVETQGRVFCQVNSHVLALVSSDLGLRHLALLISPPQSGSCAEL